MKVYKNIIFEKKQFIIDNDNLIEKEHGTKSEKKKSYKRNNKINSKQNIIISRVNYQFQYLTGILPYTYLIILIYY